MNEERNYVLIYKGRGDRYGIVYEFRNEPNKFKIIGTVSPEQKHQWTRMTKRKALSYVKQDKRLEGLFIDSTCEESLIAINANRIEGMTDVKWF